MLWNMSACLETALTEPLRPDYDALLARREEGSRPTGVIPSCRSVRHRMGQSVSVNALPDRWDLDRVRETGVADRAAPLA